MTLTILDPLEKCDRRMKRQPGALALQRVVDFEDKPNEESWTIKEARVIHIGDGPSVFRTEIHGTWDTLDAILKFDATGERQEALMNEAKAYQTKGKPLQGTVLPLFFGCFQTRIGAKIVTCLVTEYCGEPMKQPLHEVDNPFLTDLIIYVCDELFDLICRMGLWKPSWSTTFSCQLRHQEQHSIRR
ncbi:hypothetical protein B0H19DRAFT_115152 [Mycena capillaripes]|nr:hypothetical protein B0H19DRAFT_115152 [Mycena capillaripes]